MKKLLLPLLLFVFPFVGKGAINVGPPYSLLNYGVTTINPQGFPNLRRQLNNSVTAGTNGVEIYVQMGDSLMTGINGIGQFLIPAFTNNMGYAGTISGPGSSLQLLTFGAGATAVTADFPIWYSSYCNIPNGGTVTFAPAFGSFTCDRIFIGYYGIAGGGAINVQTNLNGGAFATWISINTDNGGAATGAGVWLTNTAGAVPTQVKLVGTAGTTKVMLVGLINGLTNGIVICDQAVDGQNISQFFTTPVAVYSNIFFKLKPTFCLYKCTDTAAQVAQYFPQMTNLFAALTNTDFAVIGIHPLEGAASDLEGKNQNILYYNFCQNMGAGYFDGYTPFYNFATGLRNGFLQTPLEPHLTSTGNRYEADLVLSWMDIFNGTYQWYNAPASKPLVDGHDFYFNNNFYFNGEGVFHAQAFISGVKNLQLYATTSAGVHQLVFRDAGSGAGETFVWGNNGAGPEEFAPATTLGGNIPANIGRFSGRTFDAVIVSNIWCNSSTGGVFSIIGTNAYPANWTIFQMTASGSDTNISTTTNTIWGAGTGSRRIDTGFAGIGRELRAELDGNYWTAATPGNCRFMVCLTNSTTTNILANVLFTPPANLTGGDTFSVKAKSVYRTLGGSGTISTSGRIDLDNAGTITTRYFTNNVATVDTTAQWTYDIATTNGATTDSFTAVNGTLVLR